jgi:hypothetical protein
MQVRKVAIVATGALATAAAFGSPAFAAASQGSPEVAPATTGLLNLEGAQQASDEAMRNAAEYWLAANPEQVTVPEPPQILSLGSGSAVSALATQICGATGVVGVGLAAPIASPNTVAGDCKNANIDIKGNGGDDALFSILDNTAISLAPLQICGSSGVIGAGVVAPIASPNTVGGDCKNGNIRINTTEGDNGSGDYYPSGDEWSAPTWDDPYYYGESQAQEEGYDYYPNGNGNGQVEIPEPPQILSLASGSAASVLAIQQCGSSGVVGAGVSAPIASPNTVHGDCRNANIDIKGNGGDDALFSILDNSALSVAPIQQCGSSAVVGVGAAIPIASPNTVGGDCLNGNIRIRS